MGCRGVHAWRFVGASLGASALFWWRCTACPTMAAGPPRWG